MNQLLFERATGSLGPQAFARLQATQLVHSIQHAPTIRFDGGESPLVADDSSAGTTPESDTNPKIWAHQAGVNALAFDHFDGRM